MDKSTVNGRGKLFMVTSSNMNYIDSSYQDDENNSGNYNRAISTVYSVNDDIWIEIRIVSLLLKD